MPQECQLCGLYQQSPCCLYFNRAWPLEAVGPDGADGVLFPPFPFFLSFTFSHCIFFTSRGESPSSACGSFSSEYVGVDEPLSDWVQMISLMESPIRNGYPPPGCDYFNTHFAISFFLFPLLSSIWRCQTVLSECLLCAMPGLVCFLSIEEYCIDSTYYFSRVWEGCLSHLSSCWGINAVSLDRKCELELHVHKLQSEIRGSWSLWSRERFRQRSESEERFWEKPFFPLIDSC